MSILDKLLEKKDLMAYIGLRIKELKIDQKRAIRDLPPAKRETSIKQIRGRVLELVHLRYVLTNTSLKAEGVKMWRNQHKKHEEEE